MTPSPIRDLVLRTIALVEASKPWVKVSSKDEPARYVWRDADSEMEGSWKTTKDGRRLFVTTDGRPARGVAGPKAKAAASKLLAKTFDLPKAKTDEDEILNHAKKASKLAGVPVYVGRKDKKIFLTDNASEDGLVGKVDKDAVTPIKQPDPPKKAAAKKPPMTYKQAQSKIQDNLVKEGWKPSKPGLKIPHLTSPDGSKRLWFKAQAIYLSGSKTGKHTLQDARSTGSEDIRHDDLEQTAKWLSSMKP